MKSPARLLLLLSLFAVAATAQTPAPATPPAGAGRGRGAGGRGGRAEVSSAPATDWIDPKTGHRIIRLSPDTGGSTLYFHDHRYTPEGDKILIRGAGGVGIVDLSTLGKSPTKFEVVLPNVNPIAMAWRTREAYFMQDGTLMAVNVDTKAIRSVVKMPPEARGSAIINCDESLIVGIGADPDGKVMPKLPPSGKLIENPPAGSLEPQWAAGNPVRIFTVNVKTGEFKVLRHENNWTNHLQCSPTDPDQFLFAHEGPWHYVDRSWAIRSDGSPARLLHERTMNMEIAGHEFFGQDGKSVWYDLQTPMSGVFWLAGVNLETGHRTWYNLQRDEWSVHFNVSLDGKLFCGDGGGPTSVAARTMDRDDVQGQGQWIYLFRPVMTSGSSFRDKKDLIDVGYFKSERLVDMSNHNYSKETGVEPNLAFTPDGKWIIFSGNFHTNPGPGRRATTHVYAVEIAKHEKENLIVPLSRSCLLLAFALIASSVARAEIEFSGVLLTSARSTFALSEGDDKPVSWRALGQDFAGYTLAEFDAKADTLVLTKDGATLRVHLKDDAKVKNARVEISGALKLGAGQKLEINRATLVFDQENIFPLTDGFVVRIKPTRRPDGNILYRASFERPGPNGKSEIVSMPSVITLPEGSFNVQVGDIAFGFTPKPN